MAKVTTTICLPQTTHELVKRKGWNLSSLVEQAIWAKEKVEREKNGEVSISELADKAALEARQKVISEFEEKQAQQKLESAEKEARLLALRETYSGLFEEQMAAWVKAKTDFGIESVEALELAKGISELRAEAKSNGVVLGNE